MAADTRQLSGDDYLRRLVAGLAETFGGFAEVGIVAEDGVTIRAEICSIDGENPGPLQYQLSGTPCTHVLKAETQFYASGLQRAFPENPLIVEHGYDSYLGSPMFDSSGNPIGLVCVLSKSPIPIGDGELGLFEALASRAGAELDRLRAVEARVQSETRFREMIDLQTEMVCRFDADGRINFVNRAYCEMFGVTEEEVLGRPFRPIVHSEDMEIVEQRLSQISARSPRAVVENRILDRDGDMRWTQWTNIGIFDDSGRVIAYQATGRDITPQRLAEERLRRQQDRLRFLAEYSSTLASSLDLEQTLKRAVRLVVPYFADSCAVSLVGKDGAFHVLDECHVDPEVERRLNAERAPITGAQLANLQQTLLSGESVLVSDFSDQSLREMALPSEQEERVRIRDIRSWMLVPLIGHDHTLGVLTLTTSRGHSNRTYDQVDLRFAEALGARTGLAIENARLYGEVRRADQQKDQFLAVLAHELRNPIAAVINAVSVLELSPSEESRARALTIAKRQALQQARLIDDLLDVSRITRGKIVLKKTRLPVFSAVRDFAEAKRSIFDAKQQTLSILIPDDPNVAVEADPARLEQIVVNLLDNASKYTPSGGWIRIAADREDGEVVVRVTDDGEGIEPKLLPGIFDMFEQAPRAGSVSSGLGIGLTVVRELVKSHGGSVAAHSHGLGCGCTFTVRLPVAPEATTAAPDLQPGTPADGGSRRILVVDDNVDAADALQDLLNAWGHEVVAVNDGPSAIRAATDFEPELAFIDIAMPGMDGYSTARAIRETERGTQIQLVALTGYGQPADVQKALQARFDRHLTKPARPDTLRNIIEDLDDSRVPRSLSHQS